MSTQLHDRKGNLIFDVDKIELMLKAGEIYTGVLEISEADGQIMEGSIISSSIRLQLDTNVIRGSVCRIGYTFYSEGMMPGDTLKGGLSIVSDMGEYMLPFLAEIEHEQIESSIGTIKNLFHFTNLARSDWEEAVKVFSHPNFINIMTGHDSEYRDLYIGLNGRGNKNYNLEEFLIGINKKQMTVYSLDKEAICLTDPQGSVRQMVTITRNGWGYTGLAVKCEGDFIELTGDRITEENFDGNICNYEFIIHEDKLRLGKNFGRITFRSLYGSFGVSITVANTDIKKSRLMRKQKVTRYSLVRHYMDYATKRISHDKWLSLTDDLLRTRVALGDDELECNLYKTHILLIQERFNEAKWLLDRKISEQIEDASDEMYCYYLYLTALYNVDDYYARQVADRIKNIYERNPDNWRVAWVLLHISDDFKKNPSRMYAFAIRQLARGCNSPLFYVEIIRILNQVPSLLVHFDEEENRLLYFAARLKLIDPELQAQIAYHGARKREFDECTLKTLINLYDMRPDDETVHAICAQLLKGNLIGTEYFKYYELGLDKNISITRLYENYMLSMDITKDNVIPREILVYFSYQSNLPATYNAYLYAYVVKNRNSMPDMYALYLSQIERFIVKQLYSEKVGRDLAYLYQEVMLTSMRTVDNLKQFAKILLVHKLTISDQSIVNVVVMDERLKRELIYPVNNGVAFVSLPSSNYTVLLEDTLGNRFYHTKEYSTERYFLSRKLVPAISEVAGDSLIFNLYVCEGNMEYINITDSNASRYEYLENHPDVSDSFRAAIRLPLIRYYQDVDDSVKVDELLGRIGVMDVAVKDRDELLKLFVIRGMITKAYTYALFYGPETVDPKIMVRIASLIIEKDGLIEDYRLTAFVHNAFTRGKYNEDTLAYLVRFYDGSSKELRNIWKAAAGFDVDTYSICEKMILQTLRTGAYIGEEVQVLKEYVAGGAKMEVLLEYLTYFAHEHFVNDRLVDDYMFREMARMYENEGDIPLVCMLAFLKHYADNQNLIDDDIKSHIRKYINVLYIQKKIIMPYMKEFRAFSPEAMEMAGITTIEYHGEPGSKVKINYQFVREDSNARGYIREEMMHVYGGVFVKSFILFFGESVQYYITDSEDGLEQLTESGTLSKSDADADLATGRFSMINDIAIAATLKDYDTALLMLEEYKYKEYLVENLFDIM